MEELLWVPQPGGQGWLQFPDRFKEKGGGLVPCRLYRQLWESLKGCREAPGLASGLSLLSAKHIC